MLRGIIRGSIKKIGQPKKIRDNTLSNYENSHLRSLSDY